MGILATLFGRNRGDGRYVSKKAFETDWSKQASASTQTLKELRKHDVTEQTQLKLEYFFYTDTAEKAAAFADALLEKGYTAEHGPSAAGDKTFLITGWTTPMTMDGLTVVQWSRQMCKIGFEHDCDFDGWGTYPDQDEDAAVEEQTQQDES